MLFILPRSMVDNAMHRRSQRTRQGVEGAFDELSVFMVHGPLKWVAPDRPEVRAYLLGSKLSGSTLCRDRVRPLERDPLGSQSVSPPVKAGSQPPPRLGSGERRVSPAGETGYGEIVIKTA